MDRSGNNHYPNGPFTLFPERVRRKGQNPFRDNGGDHSTTHSSSQLELEEWIGEFRPNFVVVKYIGKGVCARGKYRLI